MREGIINAILEAVKAPINHPLFFSRVFALTAKKIKRDLVQSKDLFSKIFQEEYDELSRRLDRSSLQESTSVRNTLRSRVLATALINDKGELEVSLIPKAIEELKKNMYSLGPTRQFDGRRQEQILRVLNYLMQSKELVLLLKKISRPLSNKYAEDLIRATLSLPSNTVVSDAHARRAALAAWFCYLRQNVGSCFATAPAIMIHNEQPQQFLLDLSDIIATGRLKRTFSGIEYTAPLNGSWGNGDLKKPLIIQQSLHGFSPEIWYSPGLIQAFEAARLLNKEDSEKQKINQIKNWIEPLFQYHSTHQKVFVITTEEIIRTILLQTSGLTEQNIKDFENRPKGMMQGQLMIQNPRGTKNSGGMGERCANFLFQLEEAKNAFKALTDNALLKAWEFTLASFSETKLEFTKWNLFASLGLGTNEPGGIGECIYQNIQRKLEVANRRVEELQAEYETVFSYVKMMEGRMRLASTEKELQWLKAEYQSRMNEFYSLEEMRDDAQYKAKSLVKLYDALYQVYQELFRDYFQEVYDPDMQEVTTGPFDDSPAGFRLLYKHGRSNTSQWTKIKNHNEFVDSLVSFFSSTESQVSSFLEEQGIDKDLADVVTAVINHVKTKEFIESAFYRMAVAHGTRPIKDPLQNLEYIEKKPWVYTSGGTMNTLVSNYYKIEDKPKEVAKWVENDTELLVFLADTIKHIPQNMLNPYFKGERESLLMQSPTHAFTLKPFWKLFKELWHDEAFTYTFIRDKYIKPTELFIEDILLDEEMSQYMIDQMIEKIPVDFQPRFKNVFGNIVGTLNPTFFREYIVETMYQDRGLNYKGKPVLNEDEIDSLLYSHLPLTPISELRERIHQIFILLPGLDTVTMDDILMILEKLPVNRANGVISAIQLQNICKGLLCLANVKTSYEYNYQELISLAAQKLGFAMPPPILFADTNWIKDDFGFVVNPGTGKLELWRVDSIGQTGFPMSTWRQWLNGSRQDQKWGVYVKPPEYGQY